jgi:hypothetical protein
MAMRIVLLLVCFFSSTNSLTLNPYRQPLETLLSSLDIVESNLKIYIHPNPFPNPSCHRKLADEAYHFSFESAFPKYIRSSSYYTPNPEQADLFLIEHDLFCSLWSRHFSQENNRLSSSEMIQTYFVPFFQSSIFTSKYFLRNHGRDHLFIWLADNGPFCSIQSHAMSSLQSQFTKIIQNVIFITYFAMNGTSKYFNFPVTSFHLRSNEGIIGNGYPCFRMNHDLVIPQYHHAPCHHPLTLQRPYLSHFRGMIRPDQACSPGSRPALRIIGRTNLNTKKIAWNQKDIFLKDAFLGFAPSGVACWSARIYESICSQTIPIIIAREIIEPFERFFYWKNFTIKVDTEDLPSPHFFQELQNLFFAHNNSGTGSGDRTSRSDVITHYTPTEIAISYLESLHSIRQWFSWDQTSPHNAWRLIGLELFCRTTKSMEFGMKNLCQQSSSLIANSTYLMGLPAYERAVSPDLPYVDRTQLFPLPHHTPSHQQHQHQSQHHNVGKGKPM